MKMEFGGDITNQVIETGTEEVKEGIKGIEKNAKKMTIHANPKLELDAKEEEKGFNRIFSSMKTLIAEEKEVQKESDATIRKLDKDMGVLQKKLDKAGALATQLEKEAKEVDKIDTLVKSNTGYKSPDKIVKTNREGKPITQEDIWEKDKERIEKSRKLNEEQKSQLLDLSKRQKQLNTLKENELNTIADIDGKEEKSEEDIIKQYKAAVKLKKVLEEMEQTKKKISEKIFEITGKDNYDETSKITVPKSIIPNKENVSAKDAVEKYIESYKLESKLKQVYNRGLKQKEAEKAGYLEDKKFENSQDLNIKDLEEAKKQVLEKQEAIAKAEQSIDNQLNILKQETLNSVEDYLKVADKDTQNTSKRLETALGKIGTYIGSGGDLDIINNGIDEIIKNNPNLGGKTDEGKELFSYNLDELKYMLKSIEDFQEVTKEYFEKDIIGKQIDIQLDDDISKLETLKKKLQEQKENRERYIESAQEIGQLASDTVQSGDVQLIGENGQITGNVKKEVINETTNTEIPVSVVPEVEPEEFVSKITEQLKGHSVKVDVELNSENITEEVKKITEMIPDKKEIEISVKQDELYTSLNNWKNENSSSSDMGIPEQIMAVNTKTGYATNPNIKGEIAGISNYLINEVIDSATETVNAVFHSHPDELTSAFSFDDIEMAAKLLSKGITEQYVVTLNDIAKLDLSKFTEKDVKNISDRLKDLVMETFDYDGKPQMAIREEEALMNAFNKDLDLQVNRMFNDIFSQLHNSFNGNAPIDLNELNNQLLNEYNKTEINTNGNSEDIIKAIRNLYNKVTKSFNEVDVSKFDIVFSKAADNMMSRILQEFQEDMLKQAISEVTPHINPDDVYKKLSYSDFKNQLEIETSSKDIELNPVLSKTFDANSFINEITNKLLGKEVQVDIAPSENSEKFLDRLSVYCEKFNALSNIDETNIETINITKDTVNEEVSVTKELLELIEKVKSEKESLKEAQEYYSDEEIMDIAKEKLSYEELYDTLKKIRDLYKERHNYYAQSNGLIGMNEEQDKVMKQYDEVDKKIRQLENDFEQLDLFSDSERFNSSGWWVGATDSDETLREAATNILQYMGEIQLSLGLIDDQEFTNLINSFANVQKSAKKVSGTVEELADKPLKKLSTVYRAISDKNGSIIPLDRKDIWATDQADLYKTKYSSKGQGIEWQADFYSKNPLEIDAKGGHWTRVTNLGDGSDDTSKRITELYNSIQTLTEKRKQLEEENQKETKQYIELRKELGLLQTEYNAISDSFSNVYGTHYTNDWVEYAEKNGYDALKISNIDDDTNRLATSFAVFSEEQVKNVKVIAQTEEEFIKLHEKFVSELSSPIIETETTQPTLEGNKQYDNSEEIASMSKLKQEVDKVTTSVDEKTNAFREEEQVVAGEVIPREISELERLSGELVSVRDDIEKITSAITTLPKIDFDVDLSKLNIENIDGAAIASFNTFREQLAGLEAQLNVSNLSEKLVHISEAFERLSRIENLENLNTKNLNITPIVQLVEKAGSITELVEALNRLKECLDGLKAASFDSDYFDGLKLTKANVNNMADMAVALETVGIALQSFDTDAKESLSSINELLGKSEDLKNLSSIVKKPTRTKEVKKEVDNEPTASAVNKSTSISDNISNGTYKNDVEEVTVRFSKLNKEIKYNEELMKELNSTYDKLKSADGIENKIQAYKEFEKALASARNELSGLEKKSKGLDFVAKIGDQFNKVEAEYKEMSYLSPSLETLRNEIARIQDEAKEAGADLTKLGQDAKQAFTVFNKGVLPSGNIVGSFGNLDEAIAKAKSMVNEYDKVKTELKTPLQVNNNGIAKMTAQVVDLNGELKTLTFVYNDTTKTMVQQTTNIRKELSGIPGVVDAVKNKLKDMAVYWTATMFDPTDVMFKLREIADVVIDLNTQMTELAKVSDLSIGRLEERFNDWASTAKDLGATISDTISATADWSRLGYSVDDAERLAEVSILYKNVGDGIDIDAANESLVSTLQGFQMEASQAESIIDSFNEVSNNFAISSGGIGEALQRSAASFYAANTDLNSAIALITATNSVIQDPTRVGNMWKTVSMRIRGAATELEEAGLETDGMVQSTSQLRDLIKQMTGFDIMVDNTTFKDMKDIIVGIGKEWKNLSDIDQAALLEKLAG